MAEAAAEVVAPRSRAEAMVLPICWRRRCWRRGCWRRRYRHGRHRQKGRRESRTSGSHHLRGRTCPRRRELGRLSSRECSHGRVLTGVSSRESGVGRQACGRCRRRPCKACPARWSRRRPIAYESFALGDLVVSGNLRRVRLDVPMNSRLLRSERPCLTLSRSIGNRTSPATRNLSAPNLRARPPHRTGAVTLTFRRRLADEAPLIHRPDSRQQRGADIFGAEPGVYLGVPSFHLVPGESAGHSSEYRPIVEANAQSTCLDLAMAKVAQPSHCTSRCPTPQTQTRCTSRRSIAFQLERRGIFTALL